VGIMSCQRDRPYHKLVRETWLQNEVDHRFFLGGSLTGALLEDEVLLDVPDEYCYSRQKLQGMIAWTLEHEYDFMFKCDTDTYVCVPRLLTSGFERWDWSGGYYGGSGYWLNKTAMGVLSKIPLDGENWAEDQWVTKQLQDHNFTLHGDSRYRSQDDLNIGPAPSNDFITTHCYKQSRHYCKAYERLAKFPSYYKIAKDIK